MSCVTPPGAPSGPVPAGRRKMGEAWFPARRYDGGTGDPRREGDSDQGAITMAITPSLWFNGNAEEAMHYYVSVFPNSEVLGITRYTAAGPGPEGEVMTVDFRLDGLEFTGINAGPEFSFTEAVSFVIPCETQAEVDAYWEKLTDGGEPGPCGWLKDRFGLSWQVVPNALTELLAAGDPERAARVTQAMLQMSKLDIAALQQAWEGAA
jgi:predicted 3-demethylubiquinone-9 3-methyltransferase (glyoxalase superfamily)